MSPAVPAGAASAYALSMRTIDEQLRRIDASDTKAGVLIAADAETHEADQVAPARLPRPVPGGILYLESLGRFVDNLLGDARMRARSERALADSFLSDEEMPEDPPPVEPPPPLPEGREVLL